MSDAGEGEATGDGGGASPSDGGAPGQGGQGSGSEGGAGDGGAIPEGLVPMFVALGQGARTITSCDDGQTWVGDQWETTDNSDHGPFAAKGLAYGDGVFVAGLGWGAPARLRRSNNGVDWTETYPPVTGGVTQGVADVAYGNGKFVAISGKTALVSSDGGETWQEGDVGSGDHVRTLTFGDYRGGRFVLTGDAGRIQHSSDGITWQWPSDTGGCPGGTNRTGGISFGGGVFVIVRQDGVVCRSGDGGDTWSVESTPFTAQGNLLFEDESFYALDSNRAHRSGDGFTWSTSNFNLPSAAIRQAARDPASGTFAGVARDGVGYFRSPDGTSWTQLASTAGPPGTDLVRIEFGYGLPSSTCPPP